MVQAMTQWIKNYKGAIYVILDMPLNVINYLFVVLLGAYLSPIDYGQATAFLALLAILITPGIALQSAVARQIARDADHQLRLDETSRRILFFWLLGLVVAMPLIQFLLNTNSIVVLILLLVIVTHGLLSWQRGQLQGHGYFFRLSSSMYTEMLLKLVVGILLVRLFNLPSVVMVCVLLAYASSLIWTTLQIPRRKNAEAETLSFTDALLPFLFQLSFIQISMNLDLLVVNRLNPDISGFYAATIRYGQLIAYLMLSVQTVLIPWLAHQTRHIRLDYILGLYGGFAILILVGYRFIVPLTIPYLFNQAYLLIQPELIWVAMSYLMYALLNLLILVFITRNLRHYQLVMIMVLAILSVLYLFMTDTIRLMLLAQIVTYGLACIVLLIAYHHQVRKSKQHE